MIWIEMEKPKSCWWLDPDNNLIAHKCPFLDREHECILQARINLTCEKRYENCPLHEVTDTVSRQQAIEAVEFGITYAKAIDVNTGESKELFKEGNDALKKAVERLKRLPPSLTPSRPHDISKAKFSCPICGAEMEVTVDEWDEGGAV